MTVDQIYDFYIEYETSLKSKNRFFVDKIYHDFFDRIIEESTTIIDKGNEFFRARKHDMNNRVTIPYGKNEIGMPDKSITSSHGRANPRGINYFYLASDKITALAEVKPSIRQQVTIGKFVNTRDVKIINIGGSTGISGSIYRKLDSKDVSLFMLYLVIGFSKPISDNNKEIDYLPYQYFAEYCKQKELEGIAFPSSVMTNPDKEHLCYTMFSDINFDYINSDLIFTTSIKYEYE